MNLISQNKIKESKKDLAIVEETAKQLQKDFQLFEEKILFSGNHEMAYEELNQQIVPIIDRLLNLDSERFFSLLYAIDLDEKMVKQIIFEGDKNENPAENISHLILERELLKVLTRRHFSNQFN